MNTTHTCRFLLLIGSFGLISSPLFSQTAVTPESAEARSRENAVERAHEAREASEAVRDRAFVYSYGFGNQEKSSRLQLHKHFNGQTVSKEGEFTVEETVTRIKLNISGTVKSGKIKLTVFLPGGTKMKSLSIDDVSDMNWATSFSIEDGETKYHGTWKYKIETEKADGMYSLSLTTY